MRIKASKTVQSSRQLLPCATRRLNTFQRRLLIQGTKDELHPGALEYAARLKKAGVPSDLVLLEGAPHGMGNWEGYPEWALYKRKLVDWLRSVFERHECDLAGRAGGAAFDAGHGDDYACGG